MSGFGSGRATVPYSRALERKDDVQVERLLAAYLNYTLAATAFAEKISPQIFGRPVPQILLAHANDDSVAAISTTWS